MKVYDVLFHPLSRFSGIVGASFANLDEAKRYAINSMLDLFVAENNMTEREALDCVHYWQAVDHHPDQIQIQFYDRRDRKAAPMDQYLGTATIRTIEVRDDVRDVIEEAYKEFINARFRANFAMHQNKSLNRQAIHAEGYYLGMKEMAHMFGVDYEPIGTDIEV